MSLTGLATFAMSAFSSLKKPTKELSQRAIRNGVAASSMSEYTRSTRAEPIAMIDHTIVNLPEMTDLMKSLTSIFGAMYTQSFSIAINQQIGNIEILKTLDKINPNRGKMESMLTLTASMDSYDLQLPDYKNSNTDDIFVSMESAKAVKANSGLNVTGSAMDTEVIGKFSSNLSTGMLIQVSVNSDKQKLDIPITIRLLANQMPANMIVNLLDAAVRNRTAKERYREWRSGAKSFINDIVLCRDILKEYRSNLIKDTSNTFDEIIRRKNSNSIKGLITQNPSISNVSNIVIVSKDTVNEFERESNKRLRDLKTRNLIFNNTQCLILAVVNTARETVTLYYHDITVPTTVTFRELKSSGKSNNTDMMELLKMMQLGNGITL